jgi:hypothetical protein
MRAIFLGDGYGNGVGQTEIYNQQRLPAGVLAELRDDGYGSHL